MTTEIENNDSPNVDFSIKDLEGLEGDALKEKVQEIGTKYAKTLDTNRQLFARAKKAEGFEQNEKGEWIKTEVKQKPEPKESKKSDDKLSERYNKVAMKLAGLVEADEVEFFEKWKVDNGYENADIDMVLDKKGFKSELADFRTAKANQQATSNIKGEKGDSGIKNTPEYWLAKATKGDDGKIRLPDETPKELYSKILDKMAEKETGSSEKLKFYN